MKVLLLFDLARRTSAAEHFSAESLQQQDKPTEAHVLLSLQRLGHEVDTLPVFDDVISVVEKVKTYAPEVVFNLTEAVYDDRSLEPNVPALLDLLRVRYTGAGPQALVLCKDKGLTKELLSYHRVRVARFLTSHRVRPLRRLRRFTYPGFVKPVGEEGSEGISLASLVSNEQEALERARFIHEKFRCDALIEEYIDGRELYLSVMGNRRPTVFPPREIFFEQAPQEGPKFATFKAKWDEGYRKKWGIRNDKAGPLPEGMEEKLARVARRVYRLLRIRGFGRIDVRLTPEGEIVVMEVNPNPSLAQDEDFAQSALAAGIDYDQLIQKIAQAALDVET